MRILILIAILGIIVGQAWGAYVITCPSKGIMALNKTGQETIYINGVATNYIFTVNDYDAQLNATDCYINQVPDNTVYSGNALVN